MMKPNRGAGISFSPREQIHFLDRILKNDLGTKKRPPPPSAPLWVKDLKEIRWESVGNEGWMKQESHPHVGNLCDEAKSRCRIVILYEENNTFWIES